MFRIEKIVNYYQTPSQVNLLGVFALIISCATVFCTFYFIFLTKRAELKKSKFEKFCITPLDKLFEDLDSILLTDKYVLSYRQNITNKFLDIQMLVITLKKVYNNIPFQNIIDIMENFTDDVYSANSTAKTDEFKEKYLGARILIYNEFFNFATKKEMAFRFWRKKK